MTNTIHFRIDSVIPMTLKELHDESCIHMLKKVYNLEFFNIYYLSVVPRLKFDVFSIRVDKETICIRILDNKRPFDYRMDKMPLVNREIPIKELENLKYLGDQSTPDTICFNFTYSNQLYKVDIPIKLLDKDPEILYIGKSKNIINRIRGHKTFMKMLSDVEDTTRVRIHLCSYNSMIGGKFGDKTFNSAITKLNFSDPISSKDSFEINYGLLEIMLINFYQPKYNIQHMKTDLDKENLIKENLIKPKVNGVSINMEFSKSPAFKFWSENMKGKSSTISFNFDEPHLGFGKGYQNLSLS